MNFGMIHEERHKRKMEKDLTTGSVFKNIVSLSAFLFFADAVWNGRSVYHRAV